MASPEPARAEQSLEEPFTARAPRRRTCLTGKLVFGEDVLVPDGAFMLDCSVRNLSDGGAKVTLARNQPLPHHLYLIVVKYCVAYFSNVVWQDCPARGLEFTRTYRLTENLPNELKYLRQLWIGLSERSSLYS